MTAVEPSASILSETSRARIDRPAVDSVCERDIDLLFLVELFGSPRFRQRLINYAAGWSERAFVGAWRGFLGPSGDETDILLVVDSETLGQAALMIENKIDAIFQDRQAERYRERGEDGVASGLWDTFRTVLFAPRLYLEAERAAGRWGWLRRL